MVDLFFRGKFESLIKMFYSCTQEEQSEQAVHLTFASLAILGQDIRPVASLIPSPLREAEFWDELHRQLSMKGEPTEASLLRQPRFLSKNMLAAGIALQAGKTLFVETGTFIGSGAYKIHSLFDNVWTVEADHQLHMAAKALFSAKEARNIVAMHGHSVHFLESFEQELANKAVFFVDAHYSTGITSKSYGTCPVVAEISTIVSRAPDALIVVDDVRTMDGRRGYPTLNEILDSIPGGLDARIKFDQLIVGRSPLFA